MSGFSFGLPISKGKAQEYQNELQAELVHLILKQGTQPSNYDEQRIQKIRRYFAEIGKSLTKDSAVSRRTRDWRGTGTNTVKESMQIISGDKVLIEPGSGASGGEFGQDFRRVSGTSEATVLREAPGGNVWVQFKGNPYEWRVRRNAIKTLGKDSTVSRRMRLHRALDCVLDSKTSNKFRY